jgi:DNA-directed RNA polymerase specialized sigma24 family protein
MDAILLIAKDKTIYDYSFKVAKGNDLHRDIVSEIIIYLSDLENEKFNAINDLKSYVCKMIYFSWNSPTSPFYRKYRGDNDYTHTEPSCTIEDSATQELFLIEERISKFRYPTEVRLFQLYVEIGNYRDVAKLVGLPKSTVFNLIKQVRMEMRKNI